MRPQLCTFNSYFGKLKTAKQSKKLLLLLLVPDCVMLYHLGCRVYHFPWKDKHLVLSAPCFSKEALGLVAILNPIAVIFLTQGIA